MYSTCLFCHSGLGTNQVVEHFPVGRRLAFDSAKGRLWVVCRRCERWNLTPLEERWEAIEECERLFTDTRRRVSTDNIGMAKLPEGCELVRIGSALRPEMAAWRYGDQFGRRRVRHMLLTGAGVATVGGVMIVGPATGLIAGGGWGMWQLANFAHDLYQNRRTRLRLTLPDEDRVVALRKKHLDHAALVKDGEGWMLSLSFQRGSDGSWRKYEIREYRGEAALRLAGQVLPKINSAGASRAKVQGAVKVLEQHADPMRLFAGEARAARWSRGPMGQKTSAAYIANFPLEARLALEMAAHEEQERRAMEGELAILEAAWRDAEEVARIADDLFLPEGTEERLAELRAKG
jgi:hypothetical protein